MLKNVLEFIKKNRLIENGERILIGLSGGADSVCLTHILYSLKSELNIELFAAHVNHGIRGEEAKRDEEFAKNFAKSLDIPIFIKHADVITEAKNRGVSEEMCGRQIRYEFFEETVKEHNINKIATAHNKNDTVETVLMNFIRGSSLAGLCGIPAKRGNIIRPILPLTREAIIAYVNENKLDYVTDSTNLETVYTRNKIRLDLIPYLEQHFNTNFTNTVYHSSDVLYREHQFLEEKARAIYQQVATEGDSSVMLSLAPLLENEDVMVKRTIRYAYYQMCCSGECISYRQTERLYQLCIDGKKGKQISLPGGIVALLSGEFLVFKYRGEQACKPVLLEAETPVCFGEADYNICLSKSKDCDATFCYPIRVKAGDSVWVRQRCAGDKLYFQNIRIHKNIHKMLL